MQAYVDWAVEKIQTGNDGTLLTFMFKDLKGSEASIKRQMMIEIESVYSRMLPRIVRYPGKTPLDQYPCWLICFDWPVAKSEGKIISHNENGGLHVHVIVMMPHMTRMKVSLAEHVRNDQAHYAGRDRKILTLHAEPIVGTPRAVVGYVLKQLARGRIAPGEVEVLPRHPTEMPS